MVRDVEGGVVNSALGSTAEDSTLSLIPLCNTSVGIDLVSPQYLSEM